MARSKAVLDACAAAQLGRHVQVPPQYWRSRPRGFTQLFGEVTVGQR